MTAGDAGLPEAVRAARSLFDALDAAGARHVHWKSNEHLDAALAGLTDLDVLFDRRQYDLVRRVLAETGYKPFRTTDRSGYPGIEDHIALDRDTGRLVHCHAHFLLSVGRRYLKGHRLPWEDAFLQTATRDPDRGVMVADPALELITLLVRATLKLRVRDRLGAVHGRPALRGDLAREFEWLSGRADPRQTLDVAQDLLGGEAAEVVRLALGSGLDDPTLRRLRRAAAPALEEWRTHGRLAAIREGWIREAHAIRMALNRRSLRRAVPGRRLLPAGGILVAFVGADGSGKSTVVDATSRRLASKLDVLRLYMGSGDGPVSLLRSPLRPLARAVDRRRRDPPGERDGAAMTSGESPGTPRRDPNLIFAGRVLWALSLAREKRHRLALAWRARNRGLVVIADRYPQAQIEGFSDGPLLRAHALQGGALLRRAASMEETPYRLAARQPPDLIVRLRVTPRVAVSRKPEMTEEEIARRDAAIAALAWAPATTVVDVDADRPLDEVLRDVLAALWNEI